jgi:hypothetical protein
VLNLFLIDMAGSKHPAATGEDLGDAHFSYRSTKHPASTGVLIATTAGIWYVAGCRSCSSTAETTAAASAALQHHSKQRSSTTQHSHLSSAQCVQHQQPAQVQPVRKWPLRNICGVLATQNAASIQAMKNLAVVHCRSPNPNASTTHAIGMTAVSLQAG